MDLVGKLVLEEDKKSFGKEQEVLQLIQINILKLS